MNIRMIVLMASVFSATAIIAAPLTNNELFSAIDGEYEYNENDSVRINYDLLPQAQTSGTEIRPASGKRTEFHFSLDAREVPDMNETFEQASTLWVPGE